jgi:flagellar biosynthetic protein FliR
VEATAPVLGLDLPLEQLVGTLLVALRITAFIVIAPPFSHRAIPARVKALLAVALAMAVAPAVDMTAVSTDAGPLLLAATWAVLTGGAMGFCVYLLFAAVQAAGDALDIFGGFQLASAFDPLMQSGSAIFGRFYQLFAVVLLFASDGHLVLLRGLARTFTAVGVTEGVSIEVLARVVTAGSTQLMVAALQIAGPLIAVLFLTDVGLGLLTRAAPALNAFALGFPLKILVTLTLASVAVALLPSVVGGLSEDATEQLVRIAQASDEAAGADDGSGVGGQR